MATLGKTIDHYLGKFAERGFCKQAARDRGPLFASQAGHFVSYDRTKGGEIRIFLGVCAAPPSTSSPAIEAESRWWRTDEGCTLQSAAAEAWEYLIECGFPFLDDPLQLTPTQWRERYDMLVRDRRIRAMTVTWPAEWRLNEVVIRSKRCIPEFTKLSALELCKRLQKQREVSLAPIPLANALELQTAIEMHGFTVNICNT